MLSQAHLQCLKVGQDRIGSLGQSGTLLPFTAVVGNSCSFMVNTEQVLAWISPVKRLALNTMPLNRICFDLLVHAFYAVGILHKRHTAYLRM